MKKLRKREIAKRVAQRMTGRASVDTDWDRRAFAMEKTSLADYKKKYTMGSWGWDK